MIYRHKKAPCKSMLSAEEKSKLKKLLRAKPTAWMIDERQKIN